MHAELVGALREVAQHPFAVSLLVVGLALVGVLLALGQHGVDEPSELVGSGSDGLGLVHARAQAPEVRPQRRLAGAQGGRCEYTVARFAVEVASLVRAEANLSSDKPFRLETAVIENTGNPRKSVFIPKDLTKGYGEGMYYQAIVLRQTM